MQNNIFSRLLSLFAMVFVAIADSSVVLPGVTTPVHNGSTASPSVSALLNSTHYNNTTKHAPHAYVPSIPLVDSSSNSAATKDNVDFALAPALKEPSKTKMWCRSRKNGKIVFGSVFSTTSKVPHHRQSAPESLPQPQQPAAKSPPHRHQPAPKSLSKSQQPAPKSSSHHHQPASESPHPTPDNTNSVSANVRPKHDHTPVPDISPAQHSTPSGFSTYSRGRNGLISQVCIKFTFSDPSLVFLIHGWSSAMGHFGSLPDGKLCVPTGIGGAAFVMDAAHATGAPQSHTKFECTFDKDGASWCNVSVVDGFSIPMKCYANGQYTGGGDLKKTGVKCGLEDRHGNCVNQVGPTGPKELLEKYFQEGRKNGHRYWNWHDGPDEMLRFRIDQTNDFYCHVG